MRTPLFIVAVMVSFLSAVGFADHEDIEHCAEHLVSIGVGHGDAWRECQRAGHNAIEMSHCSVALNRRGVRADHSVRECQNQGNRVQQFALCVINLVDNHGVRTDIAVRRCR